MEVEVEVEVGNVYAVRGGFEARVPFCPGISKLECGRVAV